MFKPIRRGFAFRWNVERLNIFCLTLLILNTTAFISLFQNLGYKNLFAYSLLEALFLLLILLLNYAGKISAANIILLTVLNVRNLMLSAAAGKDAEPYQTTVLTIAIAFIFIRNQTARYIGILFTISILLVIQLIEPPDILRQMTFNHQTIKTIHTISTITTSLFILILVIFHRKTADLNFLLKESLEKQLSLNNGKDIIFQNISHDVRGASFVIDSICKKLQNNVEFEEIITRNMIEILAETSEWYNYLISSTLQISKFKSGTTDELVYEHVNVVKELRKIVLSRYIEVAERNIQTVFLIQNDFPDTLLTDKSKLQRIFFNIYENAIKFSRANTTIKVMLNQTENTWVLAIADEGAGIPSDFLPVIFEPLATYKNSQNPRGRGLGLYISKYLTTLLGGDISVETNFGHGTSFKLTFPIENDV